MPFSHPHILNLNFHTGKASGITFTHTTVPASWHVKIPIFLFIDYGIHLCNKAKMISSPSSIQTASVGPLALPRRLSFILQLFELWPKQEPPAKPQNDTDDRFHVVTIQGGDTGTTSFCAELEGRSKGRGMKYCPGDTETQDLLAAGTGYYSLIAVSRFYLNKSCSFSYRNDVTLLSSQLV